MPCVTKYKGDFLWLRTRKQFGKIEYCCGECMDHEASGKWSEWRVCNPEKFKKSDLADHQKAIDNSNKHRFKQMPVTLAFKKVVEKQKDLLDGELKLVAPLADLSVTLAVEEIALHKSEALAQWAEKHGLQITPHWRSKNYGWEFVKSAHSLQLKAIGFQDGTVQRDILDQVAETKAWLHNKKFGISVDETTDIAVTKQVIVYAKAQGCTRYIGLRDMKGDGTGAAVKNAVVQLLEALEVPKSLWKAPAKEVLENHSAWYSNALHIPLKEELRESLDNDATTQQLTGGYVIDLSKPHALRLSQKPVTDHMAETCASIITFDSYNDSSLHC
ncbi:hypothetical protein FOL47_004464 [Perkinsus chesapeaki]|uniref:Uncharacterized protein n=1 Tax=Perkinsus chesapeaki TaxID=330153 RepID=A0A7J6M2J7_PERCH|nr:hypothetical protein FOL47_004464 [Perkinsus chesapeaki]